MQYVGFRRSPWVAAVLGALALTVGIPVSAGAAARPVQSSSAPGVSINLAGGSGSVAELQALAKSLPAPSAAQLAGVLAIARLHPMQGLVTLIPRPQDAVPPASGLVGPDVSVQLQWWGIHIYLTSADLHAIWNMVLTGGIGGAAAILCSPGGPWLAVACGVGGAVVGYIVAEAVWNYIGPRSTPACIDIPWSLQWHWYGC